MLDANVLLGVLKTNAATTCPDKMPGDTDYKSYKTCEPTQRKTRFAERVKTLSLKLIEDGPYQDGMGYVPDIITLQEVDASDAVDIKNELNRVTGNQFDYRVAIDPSTFSTGVDGDAAILYSYKTMRKIDVGDYFITSDP